MMAANKLFVTINFPSREYQISKIVIFFFFYQFKFLLIFKSAAFKESTFVEKLLIKHQFHGLAQFQFTKLATRFCFW